MLFILLVSISISNLRFSLYQFKSDVVSVSFQVLLKFFQNHFSLFQWPSQSFHKLFSSPQKLNITIIMSSNNSSEVKFWSNELLLPFWFCLVMHTCYITTFLIGLVGNVLMCYIIISRKRRRRGIHLLTLNLGISDLIVLLLYLPVEIYQIESD